MCLQFSLIPFIQNLLLYVVSYYLTIALLDRNFSSQTISSHHICYQTDLRSNKIFRIHLMYESLIGIQPAERERRKAKNRQLWDSNPGCLTKAAINH